jgi:hypothetical protein
MDITNTQSLPYPDCNDPGDGALDLQVLAEAIDAKLVAAFANFRAIVNRPAFIVGLSANQTGFASGSTADIIWDTTIWDSTPTGIGGLGSGVSFFQPGYWMIGCWISSVPSGGVTANSKLLIRMTYQGDLLVPVGAVHTESVAAANFQSNTGGEDVVVTQLVRQEADNFPGSSGIVTISLSHANVASTLSVNSTSMVWGFKVCDLEDM